MNVRGLTPGILTLIFMLCVALPLALADDPPHASSAIDPFYEEVASGMYYETTPSNTGPALTIELDRSGRVVIPPRFAEQEVREVKQLFSLGPWLEGVVVVGLDARSPDSTPQGFALVYARDGQQWILKAELPLRQHFLGFQECMVNQQSALVILGISGVHFHDVWVYRFPQGKPELLLAEGSSAGVDLHMNPTTGEPQVWVGVANWADPMWDYASGKRLWNVYTWTGNEFAFNKALSTARQTSIAEETAAYLAVMKEGMKEARQRPN